MVNIIIIIYFHTETKFNLVIYAFLNEKNNNIINNL